MSELSRLRGSEGYGACADEFRGGLWGFCRLYAGFPMPGVFGYGCGLFCGSGGVLLQNGKDSGAVKSSPSFRAVIGFVLSGVR